MPFAPSVLMVAPGHFAANALTAADNYFQQTVSGSSSDIHALAAAEHAAFVAALQQAGVVVQVFQDDAADGTPDSIFPNNWFCTDDRKRLWYFPMCAPNRRMERKPALQRWLETHYALESDFSGLENEGIFLEGTGSIVVDWKARNAYAIGSKRTDEMLFRSWCAGASLTPIYFDAVDARGNAIYHTNVMLAFAPGVAIVCTECVVQNEAGIAALQSLGETNTLLEISFAQMEAFCGNVLTLQSANGPVLAMSTRAYEAFTLTQREALSAVAGLVHVPLPTIEQVGGGGARCMLAELW